jgi:hypothetical protein
MKLSLIIYGSHSAWTSLSRKGKVLNNYVRPRYHFTSSRFCFLCVLKTSNSHNYNECETQQETRDKGKVIVIDGSKESK